MPISAGFSAPEELLDEVPELDNGMSPTDVLTLVDKDLLPKFNVERRRLDRIDRWFRWDHDLPHRPRQATPEYRELIKLAPTPWLDLVVTELSQGLFVEGYRRAADPDNANAWSYWQANGMDGRQVAIHRTALAYGISYVLGLLGEDPLTGNPKPVIRGISPRRGMAFYEDPVTDEWPIYFLRVDPAAESRWKITLYDDQYSYPLTSQAGGGNLKMSGPPSPHGTGVCPVVRYSNRLDLEARSDGEVEPYIGVAGRINQTVADRLIVQRFNSWVTRTISGMAKPEAGEAGSIEAAKLKLAVDSILVAEDPDTKFGTLAATPLEGYILARDADIQDLAAVTQIPPYALLMNKMANLSADALAAASAGLTNKIIERQHGFGESHEQTLRLCSSLMGDEAGALDTGAQVRWKDMTGRSLAQAADALGKLAQMLGVPVEMLWEQIPGWTDQDVERAKDLAKKAGGMDALMHMLNTSTAPPAASQGEPPSYGGENLSGDNGKGGG